MKKFLSLVLALIMTMSLVTISAGAAEYKDFTDKDEIQYAEAVAVLNRLGIITGYSEGDFRPEGELTRGAAAKIIASLLLGPEAANNLSPSSAPFKDVPLDHTFAGPISYCANLKIINGYSDGSFQPGGTLTGYAFSKMLLGALGYDGNVEGFVGPGWNMNVMRLGGETGLFNRISFKGNDPVNREEAAQLALNTLKGTMVEYSGGLNITAGDATINSDPTRDYKTSNQEFATHISNRKATNRVEDGWYTIEFGEEHFVDLRMTYDRNTLDDFGRPSNEWSYKKVTIGTFPIEPDYVYTEQMEHDVVTVTNATKARALGLTGFEVRSDSGTPTTVTVNGKEEARGVLTDIGEIADYTDNGTVVEVYISDDDADWVRNVVVVKTQLMEVKRLGTDYVALDLYDDHSDADGDKLTGFNQAPIDEMVDNVEVDDAYYTLLSGLKVGDNVAVIPVTTDGGTSYTVAKAYVPETVTGKLTRVDTYGQSRDDTNAIGVTVGDTAYDVALWNKDLHDIDGTKLDVTTKDVVLTLDEFGNALLAENVGETSDFMIIGSYYQSLINGKLVTYIQGWDVSGQELTLNVGTASVDSFRNTRGLQPGDLVYYTNENATGSADWVVDGTTARGVFDVRTGIDTDITGGTTNYSIKASNTRIMLENAYKDKGAVKINDAYVSGDTDAFKPWIDKSIKFIYVTFDDDGDVDFIEIKNGVQAATNEELKATWNTNGSHPGYNAAQAALKLKNGAPYDDSTVKFVVIKNESNDAVATNMLYIRDYKGSASKLSDDGEVVYGYEVVMNSTSGVEQSKTIYSTKRLYIGDWARYTETQDDNFENFYTLKLVNQRGRATSTMDANLSQIMAANHSLMKVSNTYIPGGAILTGTNRPNVVTNYVNNLGLSGSTLGTGDGDASSWINTRFATWVDLTGNGIDDYDDLWDLTNPSGNKYKFSLSNVKLSMIFNDDSTKDSFRSAALIIVKEVGPQVPSGAGSSANSGNWGTAAYDTTIDNGDIYVTVTLTKPSWAGPNAVPSGNIGIFYRGVATTGNISTFTAGANGTFVGSTRVANANASDLAQVTYVPNITWSTARVVCNELPQFVTGSGLPAEVDTGDGKTLTFTLVGDVYSAGTVSVSQGSTALISLANLSSSLGGTAFTSETFNVGQAEVLVEFHMTEIPVALQTPNGQPTSGLADTRITVNDLLLGDDDSWGNALDVEVKKLSPGTYRLPRILVNGSEAVEEDHNLYCHGRFNDVVLVRFNNTGVDEDLAMTITGESGVVYTEPGVRSTTNTNPRYWVFQVVSSNGEFGNSGTGSMSSNPLDDGTYTYRIVGETTGVIMQGTFTVRNGALVM